ncbi:MAG TPA: exodeoxyribonuclease VII large subunit, partial [Kiloniellales bacterium]|nr:exodeoxyribonuclease VII large subunit [Kiloniellales bacterium]
MSDVSSRSGAALGTGENLPVLTVSEISQSIRRTLEGSFEYVRVRGEISGFKRAASGHLYLSLKDQDAVLDAVCWRGNAGRLALRPEDGLEVIASGRITSYAARSRYQLVIEQLELAGEGALLKLLEERKRKLAAEGLFAAERKRPLPYLPEVIGVVTSPTGAVIRDILHRLAERFPRRVLVWPVLVQGEGAAEQVAAAIRGFNALAPGGAVPRPDVLIVARGGGSLEDLWAFNEEIVVRTAAESRIPLISAVGHETDTTLIDFAADRRAPTPTAAAEIAVPVRAELVAQVLDAERRLSGAALRGLEARRTLVEGLGRGLPAPQRLLDDKRQRLDERIERFLLAWTQDLRRRSERVADLGARLPHPRHRLALARERLDEPAARWLRLGARLLEPPRRELVRLEAERRLAAAAARRWRQEADRLAALGRVLDSVSYKKVLARGFAVVRGPEGILSRAATVAAGLPLELEFQDGRAKAVGAGSGKP